MGCYDEIILYCPKCDEMYIAQSKGGECLLNRYTTSDAPIEVLGDINRHAPFTCIKCKTKFKAVVQAHVFMEIVEQDEDNS